MSEEMKATRDGFGEALLQLGRENKDIVVLSGDLEDSTRAEYFKKEFPDRFFNLGISEQDIAGTAAGLSKTGLVPFICSFAAFWANAFGVFRVSVCYNKCNVKIVGTHSGISVGPDGATAQALEDIAAMRVLPNMSVVCPADAYEAAKATKAIDLVELANGTNLSSSWMVIGGGATIEISGCFGLLTTLAAGVEV